MLEHASPCSTLEHASLCSRIKGPNPVTAPLVLSPLMARLAESAGLPALYLGGGSMGYPTCFTEANLTVTEMPHAPLDIHAALTLPLILHGACGRGDPMRMRRTIPPPRRPPDSPPSRPRTRSRPSAPTTISALSTSFRSR